MKVVFLAAGQGKRLRPITDNIPKCMVPFKGKAILEYGIEAVRSLGIKDIIIVCGYLSDKIPYTDVKYILNTNYEHSNMVESLFCASDEFDDDLIISYTDIIYRIDIIKALVETPADIGVVIDSNWYDLWSLRMENPLDDAETLRIDMNSNIYEIGRKTNSLDEIEGQFVGLIKVSKEILPKILDFYYGLDRKGNYDGIGFNNMFMTTFLQLLINAGYLVRAVKINGGWIEIDTIADLDTYNRDQNILDID